MASANKIDISGASKGSVELNDAAFGLEMADTLVHEVAVALMAAQRQGNHETKTRKEVRGGGRKPFRQKGTGNARRGSSREPVLRGGGVVFGPHKRSYRQKVPVSFRRKALGCVLSDRVRAESLTVLEGIDLNEAKTKAFSAIIQAVSPNHRRTLIVTDGNKSSAVLSARNLDGVTIRTAADVNALDVLGARHVVVEETAVAELERRITKRREKALS